MVAENNKRIFSFNNPLLFVILILPYFKPDSFQFIAPALDNIFDLWKLVSLALTLVLYIYNRKISKIVIAVIFYELALFFSTLLNYGDYWRSFRMIGEVIAFCMIIELGICHNLRLLLKVIVFLLGALCLINLGTILLFPDGMYRTIYSKNWFLGYDNVHSLYVLPLICVFLVYSAIRNKNRKWPVLLFALSVYITWSASAVVGVTIFLLMLFIEKFRATKLFNIKFYIILNIILFFGFVIFRVQDIFSFLIEDILGKNITFTGRTAIWDSGLYWFSQSPVIGCGILNANIEILRLGAIHCHNYFLQILYQGGILAFVFFVIIIALVVRPLNKCRTSRVSYYLSAALLCFMLMFQVEAFQYSTTFFGLIILSYHAEKIAAECEPAV